MPPKVGFFVWDATWRKVLIGLYAVERELFQFKKFAC